MKRLSMLSFLLAVFVIGLSGCAPARTTITSPTVEQGVTQVPPAAAAVVTDTPEPSATPAPSTVVLVAVPGSAETEAAFLTGAADAAGMQLVTLPDAAGGITPEMRVVVFAAAPPNLAELVAGSPSTRFIVLSATDVSPAANLDVIRLRTEQQVFASGFLVTLLSQDWRSAGLLPADSALGAALQDAFLNGGRYYCGVCAPGWPLGMTYPQVVALAGASGGAEWQAAAAGLFDTQKVDSYFLAAEAMQPELIQYLAGREQFGRRVLLVGVQPPPDEISAQWAATIRFDTAAALEQIWPGVLSGADGQSVDAPLVLEDLDTDLVGEGRLRLVDEMLAELRAGRIYPFTIPPE